MPSRDVPSTLSDETLQRETERILRQTRIACVVSAITAVGVALLAQAGWSSGELALARWGPQWPAMTPWSSVLILLLGFGVVVPRSLPERWCRIVRFAVGAAVALVALAHLAGSALAPGHPFARLFYPGALAATGEWGWCSSASATGFLALAIGLVALPSHRVNWSQASALVAALVGIAGVATFFAGQPHVAFLPAYRTMSLPTALAICLLAFAELAVFADQGVLSIVTGADAGAYLARNLLPYALLVPFLLRAIELFAEHLGIGSSTARIVTLVAYVVGGVIVAMRLARLLGAADRARRDVQRELRRAEGVLLAQEERTRIALELTGIGTFEYDLATGRQVLSDHARALFGFGPDDDVSPPSVLAAMHPDDRPLGRLAQASLDPDGPGQFSIEYRVPQPDGRVRWIETRGHALFVEDGPHRWPARSLGTMRDVTARRLLDDRVREAEERARLALDAASLGTYDLDPGTGEVVWDPRARELLGFGADGACAWSAFLLAVRAEQRAEVEAAVAGALDPSHGVLDLDCRVVHTGTGITRVVHLTGRAAFNDGTAVRLVGTLRDVTEQREAETKFRAFADSVPALCWIMDAAGHVTYVNEPWSAYLGLSEPGTLDRWPALLHPDDREQSSRGWMHSLATGEPYESEHRLRGRDGRYRWFLSRARAQRDADGRVVRWFGASVDVHGARESAQALGRSEQAFRIFIDSIPSPAWTMRADGFTDYVNRPWREYFGVGDDRAAWQEWLALIHPDDLERTSARWQLSLDTGTDYEIEYRLRGADDRYRWFLARVRAQRDEEGGVVRWFGTATDIDAVKELEETLRESEAAFRLFANAIPSLGWTASADGRITYLNEQWNAYTGMTTAESLADPSAPVHPSDRQRALDTWADAVAHGRPHEVEYRLRRHDGEYRWFLSRTWPQFDAKGAVQRWFGTGTDIDDAKRAEQVLREADRRKDEFLATLAHELRNPLAPIRQASRLASMPEASAAQVQWSHGVIDRQVSGMARLLDDLLDVSRITRGRLELRKEWVSVAQLVEAALETARPLLESRRHRLRVDVPARDRRVEVDPLRMAQVIGNLLTNAAKYTEPGGDVHLTARADDGTLAVHVRDTGLGIAPEMLQRVFEMFAQATPALERTESGLGIGLALVKGIVELHGGTVEAHSRGLGHGSEFVVRVPGRSAAVPVPPSGGDAAPQRGPRTRRRVLVADDNVDGAESLAALLRVWGHDVAVAHDGIQALALAESQRPEVLLLDIGMPGLNGYELAERLRQRPWGATAVLVAVTGWGHEDDRRRSMAAGFEVHLTKPVDPQVLRALLGRRVAS